MFIKQLEPHEFSDARKSALREVEESQQVNLMRWSKKGQVSPIIWLLIGLLIVAVIVIVLYVSDDKPIPSNNSSNITQNISYFTFYVESNNLDVVNYQLSNDSNILMSGQLFPNIVEECRVTVPNASILNLSVWSDKYYFNSSLCNISVNASHCVTNVYLKAYDYSFSVNSSSIVFNVFNGSIVQRPLFCFFWEFNVLNVVVPFPRVPIPSDLVNKVSICYQGDDVMNYTLIPLDVRFRATSNDSGNLFVYIKDYESNGLNNIGLRYAGVIVQKQ